MDCVRSYRKNVMRSISRVSMVMLVVGLVSGPATAWADDIVLRWNQIAAQTATATNPFNQARIGAIVQLAVFEAVNAVTAEYEPYLNPPTVAPPGTSVEAAVIIAAHKVLTTYFPAPAVVAALDAARDIDLGAIPNGPAKTNGIAVGMAAANAMIALRAADGSSPLTTIIPTSTLPGDYQLTTGCAAGIFYNWQNVTPFGIANASDFLLDPPPSLTSNRYAKDYLEVKTVGAATSVARPLDREEVVRLYAASSPSFVLSMATRQIAAAKGTIALRERTGARVDPDGDQRRPRRIVHEQISLQSSGVPKRGSATAQRTAMTRPRAIPASRRSSRRRASRAIHRTTQAAPTAVSR